MTTVLLVEEVVKRLGRHRVLRGASLRAEPGEVVALYGANGAGKSTLLQIISGVMVPERGAVLLNGESIVGRHVRGRRRLGYVPEAANPPAHLSVSELLAVAAALKRATPLDHATRERLGIDALASQRIGQLSLGERRRACLAAALVGEPVLLVLDEPTNGLDTSGIDALAELITSHTGAGGAVLFATHDRAFAKRVQARGLKLDNGLVTNEGE